MKDLADRLRHASVDPSAGYFGTLCGFALTEIEALRAHVATLTAELARVKALVEGEITPDFSGYVWDWDNPEDSNEDTFGEYLDNQCDQECGPILGMKRKVMIARKLPDVLLTVTEIDEHDRPKAWSVELIARPNLNLEQKP